MENYNKCRIIFILSTVTVIITFLMVMVLTSIVVVPYRVVNERKFTKCIVKSLQPSTILTNTTACNTNARVIEGNNDYTQGRGHCLTVQVSYQQLHDRVWGSGLLMSKINTDGSALVNIWNYHLHSAVKVCIPELPNLLEYPFQCKLIVTKTGPLLKRKLC